MSKWRTVRWMCKGSGLVVEVVVVDVKVDVWGIRLDPT